MNRRYFLGMMSTVGAALVASRCGGPIDAEKAGPELNSDEFAQAYGTYSVYGTYGQYGSYGTYGSYGAYGSYGTYGSYGAYGEYGGYGSYGVYGSYGSYGQYGAYGSYGGVYGLWEGFRSFFTKPQQRYSESSKRVLAMLERLTDFRRV